MNTVSPHDIYNIRPDIFMKGAEDRLHIAHNERHYILRLQKSTIASIYHFLELNDGKTPIATVFQQIPEQQHAGMQKFLQFLLDKNAAFLVQQVEEEIALEAVQSTLVYLRSYFNDSAAVFRHFEQTRVLLVANSYELVSAIKTYSRIGIRKLAVLASPSEFEWQAAELVQCFDELKRWPDASLEIIPHLDALAEHAYDEVLHLVAADEAYHIAVAEKLKRARHSFAFFCNQQLCYVRGAQHFTNEYLNYAQNYAPPLAAEAINSGAVAALVHFDQLCDIRALGSNRYHYFGPSGEGILHTAPIFHLVDLEDFEINQVEDARCFTQEIEDLAKAPLFPLRELTEHTQANSYIKLYSMELRRADSSVYTLYGCGTSKQQCLQQILYELSAVHGLWFINSIIQEQTEAIRLHARQRLNWALLDQLLDDPAHQTKDIKDAQNAHTAYVSFCINTLFGVRLKWQLIQNSEQRFLALSGGDFCIYYPVEIEIKDEVRVALAFALYRSLWLRRHGLEVQNNIVLSQTSFLPAEEA